MNIGDVFHLFAILAGGVFVFYGATIGNGLIQKRQPSTTQKRVSLIALFFFILMLALSFYFTTNQLPK